MGFSFRKSGGFVAGKERKTAAFREERGGGCGARMSGSGAQRST
jgi:hypothetical protein